MAVDARPGRPQRRRWWGVVAVLLVAAAAAGGYLWLRTRATPPSIDTPVTTTVKLAGYQVTVNGPGTLSPARTVALAPSVSGRLVTVAGVGDRVEAGAVLAQIDSSTFQRAVDDAQLSLDKAATAVAALRTSQAKSEATTASQIAGARTDLDAAQRAFGQQQRATALTQTLFDMGSASATELQSAKDALTAAREALANANTNLVTLLEGQRLQREADAQDLANASVSAAQARLALTSTQQDLADTELRAPFAGVVSATNASVGEQAGSGMSLLTLVDDAEVELDAQIDESDITQVTLGQTATVTLDAVPEHAFDARVVRIAPTATLVSNIPIFYVTIEIGNAGHILRGGMTGQATIVTREMHDTFQVPARAVHSRNGSSFVMVARPGHDYRAVPVTIVGTAGISVVLTGDVADGDVVLVSSSSGVAAPEGTGSVGLGGQRRPGAVPFPNPGGGGFRRPRSLSGSAGGRP